MFHFEDKAQKDGFCFIVGIDEAGRGPLAGPVVASAVALKTRAFTRRIADSKKISPAHRELAALEIFEKAYVGIGIVNEAVIDQINILEASFFAMNRAVEQLVDQFPRQAMSPQALSSQVCLLIDGQHFKTDLPYPYQTIVRGDASVFSIACASIIAKVTRDRILKIYDQVFPQYGFARHKGYGTQTHKKAIKEHGPSLIHRRSFHY